MTSPGKPATKDVLSDLRSKIAGVLDPLVRAGSRCVLVDFPDHPNVGDSLIFLGEYAYLLSRRVEVVSVTSSRTYDSRAISAQKPDVVLIQGGGNLGDLYLHHQRIRERTLRDFAGVRVIQLPQSIHFKDKGREEDWWRLAAAHADFHLLLRDEESFSTAAASLGPRAKLCPDLSLYLGEQRSLRTQGRAVCLRRSDDERVPSVIADLKIDGPNADWMKDDRVTTGLSESLHVCHRVLRFLGLGRRPTSHVAPHVLLATLRVRRAVRLFDGASAVVTDRLHAAILGYLLGKPVFYADQSYGKLRRVLGLWLPEDSAKDITLAGHDAQAWVDGTVDAPLKADASQPRPPRPVRFFRRIRSNLRQLWPLLSVMSGRSAPGLAAGPKDCAFYLTWFSCRPHFEYLMTSIESALRLGLSDSHAIVVMEDRGAPFTNEQKDALARLCGSRLLLCRTVHPMSWGGINVVASELRTFKALARLGGPASRICKIDSDTAFTGDKVFHLALSASQTMIGHPHMDFRLPLGRPFIQGGCYVLKSDAFASLRRRDLMVVLLRSLLRHRAQLWDNVPEDYVMTRYIERGPGATILFADIQQSPVASDVFWHRDQVGRHPELVDASSVIHFHSSLKELMKNDVRVAKAG